MSVEEVIAGLNIYRAVEACGERVLSMWAETTIDPDIRQGFATVAEREGNHARALADRIRALGGEPGPTDVDDALARFVAQAEEATETAARFEAFSSLVNGGDEAAGLMATLGAGIRTALEQGDADTKAMLQEIFADEKLSADWFAANAPAQSDPAAQAAS